MLPQSQQDNINWLNSCHSDLSDSLNSLNSWKEKLHCFKVSDCLLAFLLGAIIDCFFSDIAQVFCLFLSSGVKRYLFVRVDDTDLWVCFSDVEDQFSVQEWFQIRIVFGYTTVNVGVEIIWMLVSCFFISLIRVFHKDTWLAMLALLLICIPIYLVFCPLFDYYDVSKCEIRFERYRKITFQGCIFLWSASFLLHFSFSQPKRSWKCWHPSVMGRLWKILF